MLSIGFQPEVDVAPRRSSFLESDELVNMDTELGTVLA